MQTYRMTLGFALIVAIITGGWGPLAFAQKAFVPATGQTASFAEGNDGDLQAGVPLPTLRFRDQRNGTVKDNLTNLIWLKDASCFIGTWAGALAAVADLNAGRNFGCVEYTPGTFDDWRLPNVRELHSLCDYRFNSPALSNAAGTVQATEGDPFFDVRNLYWSSTTTAHDTDGAWFVSVGGGSFGASKKDSLPLNVRPVRGGN